MGKDNKYNRLKDEDGDDYNRLKQLAKLMRGVRPKQRNKFHERKPKAKNLKDVANEYNAGYDIEDVE